MHKPTAEEKQKFARSRCKSDTNFIEACQNAGCEPTPRQYRKWIRGMGKARQYNA